MPDPLKVLEALVDAELEGVRRRILQQVTTTAVDKTKEPIRVTMTIYPEDVNRISSSIRTDVDRVEESG